MNKFWYSITVHDAFELLHDGQTVAIEDGESKEPVRGEISDLYLSRSFLKFYVQGDDEQYFSLALSSIITLTNGNKVEIIVPGKLCFTVNLV